MGLLRLTEPLPAKLPLGVCTLAHLQRLVEEGERSPGKATVHYSDRQRPQVLFNCDSASSCVAVLVGLIDFVLCLYFKGWVDSKLGPQKENFHQDLDICNLPTKCHLFCLFLDGVSLHRTASLITTESPPTFSSSLSIRSHKTMKLQTFLGGHRAEMPSGLLPG